MHIKTALATGLLTTLVSTSFAADLRLQAKLSKRAPPDLTFNTISTTQASDVSGSTYDYVIVGGGTAALAVAARLAEADEDTSILVIEAGSGGDGVEDRILPPANAYFNGIAYPSSPYDWSFYTSNQTNLSSRQVFWPRGKLLGGSSAVNGVYMTRASKREHDVWASLNGGSSWNFDDILPYYIKHETYERPTSNYSDRAGGIVVDSENHGTSGPIHYAYAGYLYNQIGSWIRTFRNLGVPTGDPASGVTTGAYLSTSAIRGSDQTRSYSRTGYFETRPSNVRILTGYQVTRVNFNTSGDTPTATGVSFRQSRDGQAYTATARREVILSAGVIGSPQLLQLSGVGPADLLNRVGIDVVHNLPGVGAHLSDHLASSVTFSSSAAVTGDLLQSDSSFNQSQYRLWENGNGNQSLYSAPNQAIAYLNLSTLLGGTSNASSYITDLRDAMSSYMADRGISGTTAAGYEAIYNAEITDLLQTGEAAVEILMTNTGWNQGQSGKTTTIQFALQHPFSRGWVNITSSDAFTIPRIDPGYLTHPSDIVIMRAALRYARRVARTAPLSDILGGELSPGDSVSSNDAIDDYILSSGSTEYHPAGSCAMLPLSMGGVVDNQLRVYGINNLRVIDSSVIPIGLAAHLTSPTYALAERGVALMLGALSSTNATSASTSARPTSTGGFIGNAANAAPTSSNVASSATSLAASSTLLLALAAFLLFSS